MSYNKIIVPLAEWEEDLLRKAASQACRRPKDHARYVILKSLGLVADDGHSPENSKIASVKVATTTTGDFAGIHP